MDSFSYLDFMDLSQKMDKLCKALDANGMKELEDKASNASEIILSVIQNSICTCKVPELVMGEVECQTCRKRLRLRTEQ